MTAGSVIHTRHVCISEAKPGATYPSTCTAGLRFASVLPPGHILAKTAEDLHRQHEFQEVLKSSSAAKTASTPAKKVQHQRQQAVPLLQLMPQKMSLAKQGRFSTQQLPWPPSPLPMFNPACARSHSCLQMLMLITDVLQTTCLRYGMMSVCCCVHPGASCCHQADGHMQLQPKAVVRLTSGYCCAAEDTVEQMRLAAYRDVLQYSSTTGSGMLLTTTHRRCSSSSSSSDNLYQPRGSPTAPWFPDTLHQDGLTGVEDWADARLAGLGCCEGSLDPGALWLPMFSAPVKSLEQIWKEGRKANTDAIFDHARLQVCETALAPA